jgi:branched-chain amino acid transport system ATP-binding protein
VAPLLSVEHVTRTFGGLVALDDVSLAVDPGQIAGLIGPNGAGKTTAFNVITRLYKPDSGRVVFDGKDLLRTRAHKVVGLGVARTFQNVVLFPQMTVLENLEMGAYLRPKADLKEEFERVYTLFPLLYERRKQLAGTMSGGEQQMLAMGRALMSRPKLLLLDEPSMGLAPLMVQKVFETVMAVSKEGVTILLIEQNAKLALEVSSRGYVMESGEITLQGKAKQLLSDPKVRAAYRGEAA